MKDGNKKMGGACKACVNMKDLDQPAHFTG